MPKLTRNFLKGRMNKDVDLRLVPPGEYRDAANIQISTSEGADVGTVQSVLGNTKIQEKSSGVNWASNYGATSTPTVIGNVRDTQNNKIYFFITSNIDAIIEYDKATGYIAPVIIDARTSDPVLNFSTNNIITGANIVDGLLFFTDDLNEPKVINIADFKSATATTVDTATTFAGKTTAIYGRNFLASDITVIKPSPKQAVSITAKSTKTAASPERGVGVTPVTVLLKLTDSNGYALSTGDTVVSSGTIIPFIAPSSVFNNKNVRLTHTATRPDGTKEKYEAIATMSLLTSGEQAGEFNGATFTIISVSSNVPNAGLIWDLVLIESEPIFKNNFPRFSYRWKYQDGEYSTYAPFSEHAFVPGGFDYEPENGYNLGMGDNIRKITLTFPTDSYALPPDNVKEIEILYKGVDSNNIYVLDTHLTSSGSLTTFDIEKDLLGPVVESNQLLRLYDNVPRKAKAQEVIGNRIVYGNYLENYTLGDEATITATTTDTAFTSVEQYYGQKSVKSNRTYQIGVSFLDEFCRESPVFTNKEAAIEVALEDANKKNKISASTALSSVPSWAKYYKYYVKDAAANYSNLVLDRFYDAEDGNIWLSFPSAERNKVVEGDFLMLKKAHGANDNITIDNKYKIIDIKNEAPKFIRNTNKAVARVEIKVLAASDFQGQNLDFIGPTPGTHTYFVDNLKGGNSVKFRTLTGEKTSALYKIQSGGAYGDATTQSANKEYHIKLVDDGFNSDDAWLNTLLSNQELELIIYENSNDLLPEFQGKFFTKVGRNASFENDIAARIGLSQYVTTLEKATVEDDLNTVSPTAVIGRMAFGNTFEDSANTSNFPADTTNNFNLYVHTGTERNSDNRFIDLSYGNAKKVFDKVTVGSRIRFKNSSGDVGAVYNVTAVTSATAQIDTGGFTYDFSEKLVTVHTNFDDNLGTNPAELELQIVEAVEGSVNTITNPAIFETQPIETADIDIYYEATDALEISGLATSVDLEYKNCIAFGNGVESNQIKDDFNAPRIDKGVRVSTILKTPYEEERRSSSLIFGGIINSRVGVNNSNQFIAAEKITKDLNSIYGGIQKLSARGAGARGDLLVLCEDKVFKVLANKDALFNADGNANLTASTNVLGQAIPFAGEYGISRNPESFASYGFRAYFADKARRAVLRLSADGLTVISDKGMRDFFSDHWDSYSDKLYAAFDERNEVYSIITDANEQVSFNETVNGWPTRLTYSPDFSGVSLDNEYFTFKNGYIYIHNNNNKNSFYGGLAADSSINVIFNDAPDKAKTFKALSYDGVAGWDASITAKPSDQTGSITDWVEKEGFYYNYIKGTGTSANKDFNVQGIGQTNADIDAGNPITFANPININVQVNDVVYKENTATAAVVSAIAADRLSITPSIPLSANNGDFFHVVKPTSLFTNSVIGNAVLVNMTKSGGSTGNNELFSVSAEVFISSE